MTDADPPPTPEPRSRGARGPEPAGRVNLRDVARRAGVSPATASRVFGDSTAVTESTRERVLSAADDLGYVVNGLARSMTGRGPRSIAFVAEAMLGPTFAAAAAGAESIASSSGNLFMICTTGSDLERENAVITTLREQRVAAVMMVGSSPTDEATTTRFAGYAATLARVDAPLILCGRPPLPGHPEIPSVDYDHRVGVAAGVAHLVGLGHSRIAYLGDGPGRTTADARLGGYLDGLRAADIAADPALVLRCTNFESSAEAALLAALDAGPAFTAVVCMTDLIAVGAYRALRARGRRLPDDVSVVGFDDVPLVADLTPGLTTVHAPFREVGVIAAEIISGARAAEHVTLRTRLVVRGSTAAPPRA